MHAEIISIGTELIIGHTINSNATYISERLNQIGISVHYHTSVGDNKERILECLRYACSRSDIIICTGGLGPTDDDITHDVIAEFCERPIYEDPLQRKILIEKFYKTGAAEIPEINYRQARIIEGAKVVVNPIGTAIGLMIQHQNSTVISFPGVPCEMEAMLESILSQLKNSEHIIHSRKVRLTDISESTMAQIIVDHYQAINKPNPFLTGNPSLAPYADLGECYLRITANGSTQNEVNQLIQSYEDELKKLFSNYIYGYDEDRLATVLATKLKANNLSISFAESCTGGLASKLMTDLQGSSEYTKINLVTYSNEAKIQMLGVKTATLEQHGAVSEECAKEMVEGLVKISHCDINVSITGIAGPDGGSEVKPIGTIYVGINYQGQTSVQKLNWSSRPLSREQVRELACKKVFWLLIKLI